MPRPLGRNIGVIWSLQLHPEDSTELEAGLRAQGYEATREGLADFIFDRLKEKPKKYYQSELLDRLAGIMQDPAKAKIIEGTLKTIFAAFRR